MKAENSAPESKPSFWAELKRRKVVRVAVTYVVVGWVIMQVADVTFEGFGIPIWAFRFVMLCVILGFPIAVIIAWAFELTPDGIKATATVRNNNVDTGNEKSHARRRNWLAYVVGASIPTLIFGTLALFFYIRSDSDPEASAFEKSIAVLPFDNRSNREEDEFFTDGIHDDLLTHLSRIKDIRTIARTSVMSYRDTTKKMSTIGEKLGVKWLLEGGVQRGGDQIRINVQLIDPATEGHLWAEIYTREMTTGNIFAIQSEIATMIAGSLKAVISPEEQKRIEKLPTQNLAALEAYFKGKESSNKNTRVGFEEAVVHLEKAVSLDPDFALAHAWLGRTLLRQTYMGGLSLDEQVSRSEPHVLKALELDPMLGDVQQALALLRFKQRDAEREEQAYQKAIEVEPSNAGTYSDYGDFLALWMPSRAQEAIRMYKKAHELDPNGRTGQDGLENSLILSGRFEEALELRKARIAENPRDAYLLVKIGRIHGWNLGNYDEAILAHRKALAMDPTNPGFTRQLSYWYEGIGDKNRAIRLRERELKIHEDPVRRANIRAEIFRISGEFEKAEDIVLEELEANPKAASLLRHLSYLYLASDQLDKLRATYEDAFPALFRSSAKVGPYELGQAMHIARILMATGEREHANRLIDQALAIVEGGVQEWQRRSEAILYAVAGDDRQTLDALRRYLEAGGSPYALEGHDQLKPILDHPEYQAMAEKRKAELAIQLERIRIMDANGELPPIPVL